MSRTRRDLLRWGVLAGATTLAGACATKTGGTPVADPSARPTSTSESSPPTEPSVPSSVTMAVLVYRPYAYLESGEFTGQVPEVARAVLEKVGVTDIEMEEVQLPEQVYAGMAAGQYDLAGGMFVTPERCRSLEHSIPDFISLTALLVPTGNPKGLHTLAEVATTGARLAVLQGLPEREEAVSAGVSPDVIVELTDPAVMAEAVRAGEVDCAAFEDITLRDMAKTGQGLEVTPGFTAPDRDPYVGAFAFPRGATEQLDTFNEALRELHESGEWLRISEPFGFTEDNEPGPDLTTEKACAGG